MNDQSFDVSTESLGEILSIDMGDTVASSMSRRLSWTIASCSGER